jgi:hypothetical protein
VSKMNVDADAILGCTARVKTRPQRLAHISFSLPPSFWIFSIADCTLQLYDSRRRKGSPLGVCILPSKADIGRWRRLRWHRLLRRSNSPLRYSPSGRLEA